MDSVSTVVRRRARPEKPRRTRLLVTYNEDELEILKEAARRSSMAVASWIAGAALDVACGVVVPVSVDARDVVRELILARSQLAVVSGSLSRVDVVEPEAAEQVSVLLAQVEGAVRRVDEATLQVMRERRPR